MSLNVTSSANSLQQYLAGDEKSKRSIAQQVAEDGVSSNHGLFHHINHRFLQDISECANALQRRAGTDILVKIFKQLSSQTLQEEIDRSKSDYAAFVTHLIALASDWHSVAVGLIDLFLILAPSPSNGAIFLPLPSWIVDPITESSSYRHRPNVLGRNSLQAEGESEFIDVSEIASHIVALNTPSPLSNNSQGFLKSASDECPLSILILSATCIFVAGPKFAHSVRESIYALFSEMLTHYSRQIEEYIGSRFVSEMAYQMLEENCDTGLEACFKLVQLARNTISNCFQVEEWEHGKIYGEYFNSYLPLSSKFKVPPSDSMCLKLVEELARCYLSWPEILLPQFYDAALDAIADAADRGSDETKEMFHLLTLVVCQASSESMKSLLVPALELMKLLLWSVGAEKYLHSYVTSLTFCIIQKSFEDLYSELLPDAAAAPDGAKVVRPSAHFEVTAGEVSVTKSDVLDVEVEKRGPSIKCSLKEIGALIAEDGWSSGEAESNAHSNYWPIVKLTKSLRDFRGLFLRSSPTGGLPSFKATSYIGASTLLKSASQAGFIPAWIVWSIFAPVFLPEVIKGVKGEDSEEIIAGIQLIGGLLANLVFYMDQWATTLNFSPDLASITADLLRPLKDLNEWQVESKAKETVNAASITAADEFKDFLRDIRRLNLLTELLPSKSTKQRCGGGAEVATSPNSGGEEIEKLLSKHDLKFADVLMMGSILGSERTLKEKTVAKLKEVSLTGNLTVDQLLRYDHLSTVFRQILIEQKGQVLPIQHLELALLYNVRWLWRKNSALSPLSCGDRKSAVDWHIACHRKWMRRWQPESPIIEPPTLALSICHHFHQSAKLRRCLAQHLHLMHEVSLRMEEDRLKKTQANEDDERAAARTGNDSSHIDGVDDPCTEFIQCLLAEGMDPMDGDLLTVLPRGILQGHLAQHCNEENVNFLIAAPPSMDLVVFHSLLKAKYNVIGREKILGIIDAQMCQECSDLMLSRLTIMIGLVGENGGTETLTEKIKEWNSDETSKSNLLNLAIFISEAMTPFQLMNDQRRLGLRFDQFSFPKALDAMDADVLKKFIALTVEVASPSRQETTIRESASREGASQLVAPRESVTPSVVSSDGARQTVVREEFAEQNIAGLETNFEEESLAAVALWVTDKKFGEAEMERILRKGSVSELLALYLLSRCETNETCPIGLLRMLMGKCWSCPFVDLLVVRLLCSQLDAMAKWWRGNNARPRLNFLEERAEPLMCKLIGLGTKFSESPGRAVRSLSSLYTTSANVLYAEIKSEIQTLRRRRELLSDDED